MEIEYALGDEFLKNFREFLENYEFLVVGGGNIGQYLSAIISNVSRNVTIKSRQNLIKLRTGGVKLLIDKIQGTIKSTLDLRSHLPVIGYISELTIHKSLIVFLACKANYLDKTLKELKSAKLDIAAIVPAGNGLYWEKTIKEYFPPASGVVIIPMVITHPVAKHSAGGVKVTNVDGKGGVAFSTYPRFARKEIIVSRLISLFQIAEIETNFCPDYLAMKISKLLLNLIGNGVCAICNLSAEKLYRYKLLSLVERAALRELLKLKKELKIKFVDLPGYPAKRLRLIEIVTRFAPIGIFMKIFRENVAKARGDKLASLHQTFAEANDLPIATEINEYHGAIVRLGNELGIYCPINSQLTDIIISIANKPNLRLKYSANPNILWSEIFRSY